MDQKQQIVNRSRELFMRYGIKSISMDDIAKELGMSKKTLYQFVENKSDLIEQIFRQKIECEKEAMADIRRQSSDAIEEILKIGKYVIEELRQLSPTTVFDLQKYYRITWKQMDALHQRHVYAIIRENIEWGMQQGLYRGDMNPDIIAKLYVGKTSLVADEDAFPLKEYPLEELFKEYIYYHIHGIASPKGMELLEKYLAEGKANQLMKNQR
jgi:AcrR family transcriptional regulator